MSDPEPLSEYELLAQQVSALMRSLAVVAERVDDHAGELAKLRRSHSALAVKLAEYEKRDTAIEKALSRKPPRRQKKVT